MPSPANMTYTSLLADAQSYNERPSVTDALVAQFPNLLMLAENRITADLRILGTQEVTTSVFTPGDPMPVKPDFWRRTVSFNYTHPTLGRIELLPRTYEYCRDYWPVSSTNGAPRFYSDYDYDHFLVVATPDSAYAYELLYIARLTPLSTSAQTNWLTDNAPQVLLAAVLLEIEIWLKNFSRVPSRQTAYDNARDAVKREDGSRAYDNNIVVA